MTEDRKDQRYTAERFAELADLAMQLIAADAATRLWRKVYAERRAMRSGSAK